MSTENKLSMSQKGQADYSRIRELLEAQESFPIFYTHKFIGKNSVVFQESLKTLELKFPHLERVSQRQSAKGNHIAMTYRFEAFSAEAIVVVMEATSQLEDVLVLL